MSTARRMLAGLLLAALTGCPRSDDAAPSSSPEPTTARSRPVIFDTDPDLTGVRIELSDATPAGDSYVRPPAADASPASPQQIEVLLSRLPSLPDEASGQADFARRAETRPAPRPGVEVDVAFPPAAPDLSAPAVASGPLHILRAAPEGEVPLAPHLSITFDQPVIAVTSQDEAAAEVPATLTPEPAGQWRWLGTRTLVFEPDHRFPMATEYTVTVPAGTQAATGGALEGDFRQTFATPAPRLVAQHPVGGPTGRKPVIFLGFDQRIDPDAVLKTLRVSARGHDHQLRQAEAAELAEVADQVRAMDQRGDRRWLAVVPTSYLPLDSTISVTVPTGTPSAEGPRKTLADQAFSFQTYGPFKLADKRCGYRDQCTPGDDIQLQFTNPIDGEAFDPAWVSVQPELPGGQIHASGAWLTVSGQKQPETWYTVTVAADLTDRFGQQLTKAVETRHKTGKDEPAHPWLAAPGPELRVLDPAADPTYAVYTVNHDSLRLRVYRIQPTDWADYRAWRDHRAWWDRGERLPDPPGQRLADQRVTVEGEADQLTETVIDLKPWLEQDRGQLLVWVEPTKQPGDYGRQVAISWVQRTDLGVTAFADDDTVLTWVTDLATGAPVQGAQASLHPTGPTGQTDAEGLARGALTSKNGGPQLVIATKGDDTAFNPVGGGWGGNASWMSRDPDDSLLWFVFDDRRMYKPKEQVHIKGWLRRWEPGPRGDLGALDEQGPSSVSWVLYDARSSELARGEAPLVGLGGFDLTLDLPDDMNLGSAWVDLTAGSGNHNGSYHRHSFEVQEFRRPEFEVSASVEAGPFVLGETAIASVTAAYYAGGGLPGADVIWRVTPTWGSYRPPNQDGWQFGVWVPWWRGPWFEPGDESIGGPDPLTATTDAVGAHHLGLHFAAFGEARPLQVTAEAVVTDVNRQAWAASTSMLVHPADVYVGMRTKRPFAEADEPVEVELIAVDIDGHPVADRTIDVRWWTTRWTRTKAGGWEEVEEDVQTCQVQSAGPAGGSPYQAAPESCRFQPEAGGRYTLQATVTDGEGRKNQSEIAVWVAGGGGDRPRDRSVQREDLTLVPDRESYQPGDVAEIMVQSPIGPAEGVLTLRRSGLVETRRFTMDSASTVLQVAITDALVPTVHVHIDLVGATARTDDGAERADLPTRPAYAGGSLTIDVPPVQRTLSVALTPAQTELSPGASTTLDLVVTDADGNGVTDAELAVVVVDESVLALTGYRIADPLAAFYAARSGEVSEEHLRSLLWLGDPAALGGTGTLDGPGGRNGHGMVGEGAAMDEPESMRTMAAEMDFAMAPPAPMMELAKSSEAMPDDDGPPTDGPKIDLRTDMRALALFLPAERTGAGGRLTVPLSLPDSLTRYRVTVLAVHGGQRFGSAEATVTARKPLMLRPSAPRFLNFGDVAELPFVVQNQTDDAMSVVLAAGAANARFAGDARQDGRVFQVPAQDRVEVRIPTTTLRAGTATFQAAVSGRPVGQKKGAESTDATELSLPVWTPATSEAFATYGELGGLPPVAGQPDPGAILQPVSAPGDVWPQFGGLEITTSSTALQALTDALLYLTAYPYECAEQRASRVLAVAALRDVLTAFDAEGLPSPQELEAAVERDLAELGRLQNQDGGFGFWRSGERSWPYVSLHVAHALARAESKGFEVPDRTRQRALSYLRNIERNIPSDYSVQTRRALRAYALYVRRLLDDTDTAKALGLYREAGIGDIDKAGLSLESLAWILPTLQEGGHDKEVEAILRFIDGRIAETAAGAQITTGYGEGDWLILHSARRTDAVILDALIEVRPRHDIVPKLVRSLLDHRVRGRWGSTQENAFVLLALDRYFNVYEAEEPDFVARAWLGETYAGDHAFRGRTTEHATISVPMETVIDLAGDQPAPLILQRDGEGRLYYRIGLRYAPKSLELEPADRGFVVLRSYEPVDDDGDVTQDADGTWQIKAGARVRVRLTMVADARRTHVALVDPLPAGLEVINPELAVSEDVPGDPAATNPDWRRGGGWWWWWRPWYEHENLRDERVEAFSTLVWAGVHEYSYVARATTPGDFVVPPTKAEEMYHPETFGRTGTDRVRVVAD